MATGQKTRQQLPREATMKYKFLIVSLMSTLSVPYGGAMEGEKESKTPITNSPPVTEHEAIMQEQITVILSHLSRQIGGDESIDPSERLQALTKALDHQAESLEEAINNTTINLSGILGVDSLEKIIYLAQEKSKDEATNRGLKKLINAMRQEQTEKNELFNEVLQQRLSLASQASIPEERQPYYPTLSSSSIPSSISPSHSASNSARFSSYQQGLLTRKDQIGSEAWKLLGGENANLAAALFNSIQQNSGTVEILSLEKNSFTLRLNGKEQDQLYRF